MSLSTQLYSERIYTLVNFVKSFVDWMVQFNLSLSSCKLSQLYLSYSVTTLSSINTSIKRHHRCNLKFRNMNVSTYILFWLKKNFLSSITHKKMNIQSMAEISNSFLVYGVLNLYNFVSIRHFDKRAQISCPYFYFLISEAPLIQATQRIKKLKCNKQKKVKSNI